MAGCTKKVETKESTEQKDSIFSGYRAGVITAASLATVVLVLNITLTLVGALKLGSENRVGTILTGTCENLRNVNIIFHLFINALSTLLLAGSNYCMQILTSPTRSEIDKAHEQHTWMDIGIPGVRNLGRIGWKRVTLWTLTGLSSLPLHLL